MTELIALTPPVDTLAWSTAIVAILTAIARLISVYWKGSISKEGSDQARFAAQWKRLDDVNDDLRRDNERLRHQLDACYSEITNLRRVNAECWEQLNRRTRRRNPDG